RRRQVADFGRLLIFIGVSLIIVGSIIVLAQRFFPMLGNLPGDLNYESDGFQFFAPFTTMLVISVLGSILLNIIQRFFR
ncbi:MAG: DUF2905 domain-containing protein, partial [Candidatus Promineifilaceae bacterium]